MDNPMQTPGHPHHNHVFDPALTHHQQPQPMAGIEDGQVNSSSEGPSVSLGLNPDGTPIKRRPGRPKGSTKKNLLAGSPLPPKIKRPVGRPRKDGFPAGSVGSRVKRERTAGAQAAVPVVHFGGVGYPQIQFGYSLNGPVAPVPAAPPMFHVDPALDRGAMGDNEWAELARTNPNGFLGALLAALAAPNPVSSAGPTVEEAFKSHLVSLAPNPTQMQPIPSLYSILKTFWLPSSPAYFSLTASASTARTPSEHRFLYWDPQPLVFNGIACPSCSTPLLNRGRISSGPVKIYDIEKPFFIVGCEYVCRSPTCTTATSPEGRKFASTDSSILRSLPMLLKDEFPARLLHGDADAGSGPNVWNWKAMGVSTGLWNLVMGGLRSGLKKDVILRLIWAVQHKLPDGQDAIPMAPLQNSEDAARRERAQTDEKMDEDEEGDEDGDVEEGDGQLEPEARSSSGPVSGSGQSQTLSSTNFQDAYGDAWKENTAMTEVQPKPASGVGASSTPTAVAVSASGTPAQQQPQASTPLSPLQPQQHPQPQQMPPQPLMTSPHGYNPYTAYPFTPYAYMPHHLVNGQMVALGPMPPGGAPVASGSASTPGSGLAMNVGSMGTNGSAGGAVENMNSPSTGMIGAMGPHTKRSPRHCCKCGSQDCKGKGGRSFCTNSCQDCGKLECKGRNSRRPDKKCSEGWS